MFPIEADYGDAAGIAQTANGVGSSMPRGNDPYTVVVIHAEHNTACRGVFAVEDLTIVAENAAAVNLAIAAAIDGSLEDPLRDGAIVSGSHVS